MIQPVLRAVLPGTRLVALAGLLGGALTAGTVALAKPTAPATLRAPGAENLDGWVWRTRGAAHQHRIRATNNSDEARRLCFRLWREQGPGSLDDVTVGPPTVIGEPCRAVGAGQSSVFTLAYTMAQGPLDGAAYNVKTQVYDEGAQTLVSNEANFKITVATDVSPPLAVKLREGGRYQHTFWVGNRNPDGATLTYSVSVTAPAALGTINTAPAAVAVPAGATRPVVVDFSIKPGVGDVTFPLQVSVAEGADNFRQGSATTLFPVVSVPRVETRGGDRYGDRGSAQSYPIEVANPSNRVRTFCFTGWRQAGMSNNVDNVTTGDPALGCQTLQPLETRPLSLSYTMAQGPTDGDGIIAHVRVYDQADTAAWSTSSFKTFLATQTTAPTPETLREGQTYERNFAFYNRNVDGTTLAYNVVVTPDPSITVLSAPAKVAAAAGQWGTIPVRFTMGTGLQGKGGTLRVAIQDAEFAERKGSASSYFASSAPLAPPVLAIAPGSPHGNRGTSYTRTVEVTNPSGFPRKLCLRTRRQAGLTGNAGNVTAGEPTVSPSACQTVGAQQRAAFSVGYTVASWAHVDGDAILIHTAAYDSADASVADSSNFKVIVATQLQPPVTETFREGSTYRRVFRLYNQNWWGVAYTYNVPQPAASAALEVTGWQQQVQAAANAWTDIWVDFRVRPGYVGQRATLGITVSDADPSSERLGVTGVEVGIGASALPPPTLALNGWRTEPRATQGRYPVAVTNPSATPRTFCVSTEAQPGLSGATANVISGSVAVAPQKCQLVGEGQTAAFTADYTVNPAAPWDGDAVTVQVKAYDETTPDVSAVGSFKLSVATAVTAPAAETLAGGQTFTRDFLVYNRNPNADSYTYQVEVQPTGGITLVSAPATVDATAGQWVRIPVQFRMPAAGGAGEVKVELRQLVNNEQVRWGMARTTFAAGAADLVAPTIVFNRSSGTTQDTASFQLTIDARDERELNPESFRVTLNGADVTAAFRATWAPPLHVHGATIVQLNPGVNTFVAEVLDRAGNRKQENLTVTYATSAQPPPPPPGGTAKFNAYTLHKSNYDYPKGIPIQLGAGILDAREYRQWIGWQGCAPNHYPNGDPDISYTDGVPAFAAANPGKLYIFLDEPGHGTTWNHVAGTATGCKQVTPAQYARAYHAFVNRIRQADPTARFSPAGIEQMPATTTAYPRVFTDYVADFVNAYRAEYGVNPPVSEWRFHVYWEWGAMDPSDISAWRAKADQAIAFGQQNGAPVVLGIGYPWNGYDARMLQGMTNMFNHLKGNAGVASVFWWNYDFAAADSQNRLTTYVSGGAVDRTLTELGVRYRDLIAGLGASPPPANPAPPPAAPAPAPAPVEPTPPPPAAGGVDVSPHNGENVNVAQFGANLSYSTPAYVSMDVPRSLSLFYSSAQAKPRGLVQVNVADATPAQHYSILLKDRYGAQVPLTFGASENFYRGGAPGDTARLAAQFDAASLATGAYEYQVIVRRWNNGQLSSDNSSTAPWVRVLVVNEAQSPYGAGWSIAGLQRIHRQTDGSLVVTGGNGTAQFYARPSTCGAQCTYQRPMGEWSEIDFDGAQYVRRYRDGTRAVFRSDGLLDRTEDRFGNRTQFAYDAVRLATVSEPYGTITLGYTGGKLSLIRDAAFRDVGVSIDAAGNLVTITDPDEVAALRVGYDGYRVRSWHDRLGNQWVPGFDQADMLASITAPPYQYAGEGQPEAVATLVRSEPAAVLPAAWRGTSLSTAAAFVGKYPRVRLTDGRTHATEMTLDRFGAPTRVRNPLGQETLIRRDEHSRVVRTQSPSGHVVSYEYEPGKPTLARVRDETLNKVVSYTHTTYDQPLRISGDTPETIYYYDASSRIDSIVAVRADGTRQSQRIQLTPDGRVGTVTDAGGHTTTYEYRISTGNTRVSLSDVRRGAAGSRTTSYVYDNAGRVYSVRSPSDANNPATVTLTHYDRLNRPTTFTEGLHSETADGQEAVTTYAYTESGGKLTTRVTDARGNVHTTVVNGLGFTESETDPRNRTSTYRYDRAGNLRDAVNRRGQTVSNTYDELGRVRTQTDHATGAQTTWEYDRVQDRWMSVANGESANRVEYDVAGRATAERVTMGGITYTLTSSYLHRNPGLRTDLQLAAPWGSPSVHYEYDAMGRLRDVRDLSGGNTHIDLNGEGIPSEIFSPAGTARYGATSHHIPSGIAFTRSAMATADLGTGYTLDANSRIGTRWNIDRTRGDTYRYDRFGRLTTVTHQSRATPPPSPCVNEEVGVCIQTGSTGYSSVQTGSFAYDKVGNRQDRGAVIDTGNRLTGIDGTTTLLYDDDGNMTSKTRTGFTQTFRWDGLGLLASTTLNGVTTEFGYDAFGRRVRKTTPSGTLRYLHDGDNLLAEVDGAGNPVREYTFYPAVDRPLAVRQGGRTYYYLTELPGHVAALVDANGQAVNRYGYTPWGETTATENGPKNPLRYAAREYDSETGLYYNRARYYDPSLGRFISEDPIGLAGGINVYAYVGNDPVNATDPSGLCTAAQRDALANDPISPASPEEIEKQCGGGGLLLPGVSGGGIGAGPGKPFVPGVGRNPTGFGPDAAANPLRRAGGTPSSVKPMSELTPRCLLSTGLFVGSLAADAAMLTGVLTPVVGGYRAWTAYRVVNSTSKGLKGRGAIKRAWANAPTIARVQMQAAARGAGDDWAGAIEQTVRDGLVQGSPLWAIIPIAATVDAYGDMRSNC